MNWLPVSKPTKYRLAGKKGNYIKVTATNHAGKIEGKMEATQLLASAMEECVDQDDEIAWPGADSARAIYRNHEIYARKESIAYLASVPIRSGKEPVAAVTLERLKPFEESDLDVLRLTSDLVSQRLVDLKQRDRWFGARWASALGKGIKKVVGVEHTLLKVSMLAVSALIVFLALFPWDYRIEAPFTLKAEEIYQLPAPFEGYIETVNVRVGDAVKAGDTLLLLDSTELKLQASELSATVQRFLAEARLARGESTPTEIHIAMAKAHESKAALEKIKFQIGMAKVLAPVDSIVVEGDLRERIGTPVTRGEALLQLSKLEGMYAELHISEKDIHRVDKGSKGLAAFAGRPKLKFPFELSQIEPIAIAEEDGNVLITRSTFAVDAEDWWRPGMSGVAKIDCGQRSLLWIFTHRAIDYLRLKLWF